jgi:hypothetical protein
MCFKYGTYKHDCIPVVCLPVQAPFKIHTVLFSHLILDLWYMK